MSFAFDGVSNRYCPVRSGGPPSASPSVKMRARRQATRCSEMRFRLMLAPLGSHGGPPPQFFSCKTEAVLLFVRVPGLLLLLLWFRERQALTA
jgi:hypothetical protein